MSWSTSFRAARSGKRARRATHITSVSFSPKSGYKLQAALSELGIAVGTGSACHDSGTVSISPVLKAMGVDELLARGTLRISLGWNSSWADVERLLSALQELLSATAGTRLDCEP
jgi:cysteine desulfurase